MQKIHTLFFVLFQVKSVPRKNYSKLSVLFGANFLSLASHENTTKKESPTQLLLKALNYHQLARATLTNLALDTEIVMSPDVHRLFAIFMPNS